MSQAYHPGCLSASIGRELDRANRKVAEYLQVGLTDCDWNCCGGAPAMAAGPELRTLTATLNLAQARSVSADRLVTGCTACLRHLEEARDRLQESDSPEGGVPAFWSASLEPDVRELEDRARGVEVLAAHELLLEAILGREPRPRVVRPLTGLSVAAYYGCRAFTDGAGRPRKGRWTRSLEEGLSHLGATVVPFGGRGECNGGYLTLSRSEIVEERTSLLIHEARSAGAQAMVVICALCHFNLSTRPLEDPLPLLYFSQAAGVALGIDPSDLKLGLLSPARRLLVRLGIL